MSSEIHKAFFAAIHLVRIFVMNIITVFLLCEINMKSNFKNVICFDIQMRLSDQATVVVADTQFYSIQCLNFAQK